MYQARLRIRFDVNCEKGNKTENGEMNSRQSTIVKMKHNICLPLNVGKFHFWKSIEGMFLEVCILEEGIHIDAR